MYSSLDTFLLFSVFILTLMVFGIILILKKRYNWRDLWRFNEESKDFFNKDYFEVCKDKGLLKQVGEVKILILKAMWAKKLKIILPIGITFLILFYLVDKSPIWQYYYFSYFGFFFSLIGLFYGLYDALKSPAKLVLQNTTFWDKNDESLKISIESQLDYMLSWFFLFLGLMLQFLSFSWSILINTFNL